MKNLRKNDNSPAMNSHFGLIPTHARMLPIPSKYQERMMSPDHWSHRKNCTENRGIPSFSEAILWSQTGPYKKNRILM